MRRAAADRRHRCRHTHTYPHSVFGCTHTHTLACRERCPGKYIHRQKSPPLITELAFGLRIPGASRSHTPLARTHTHALLSVSFALCSSVTHTHMHRCCSTYSVRAGGGEQNSQEVGGGRKKWWGTEQLKEKRGKKGWITEGFCTVCRDVWIFSVTCFKETRKDEEKCLKRNEEGSKWIERTARNEWTSRKQGRRRMAEAASCWRRVREGGKKRQKTELTGIDHTHN